MDTEAVIASYRGWLHKMAGQIVGPSSPDLDDMVQEGRIALWKASKSYDPSKGSLPAWLTSNAHRAMLTAASRRRWTGQPPRLHGRNSAAEPETLSLDKVQFEAHGYPFTLADLLLEKDQTEQAEMAYHAGEIAAAVARLSPSQRRYVTARFWLKMTGREMVTDGVFAYDPSALWTSVRNGARRKLAAALSHLGSVTE